MRTPSPTPDSWPNERAFKTTSPHLKGLGLRTIHPDEPSGIPRQLIQPTTMTPPNQTSRDRVLIVEDDPAVGQLLARILSYKDYDACVATDGPSGVDAFQSAGDDHFKLAIIDYSMPGLVGDEVAQRVDARVVEYHAAAVTGVAFLDDAFALASARAEGLFSSATADAAPAAPTSHAAAAPAVSAVEVEAARACACLRRVRLEGHLLAVRTPVRAAVLVQRRRPLPGAFILPPLATAVPWRLVMVLPSASPVVAAVRARPPARPRCVGMPMLLPL